MSQKTQTGVLGIFDHPDVCADAIKSLRHAGQSAKTLRVYSPVPDHQIEHALGEKVSPLGWATLIGAVTGLVGGYALAAYTSLKWGLVVWGKPLLAWIPWLVIGFEFTILIGCLTNFIVMLVMSGLPRFKKAPWYDPRFSVDKYGVFVFCDPGQHDRYKQLLESKGAVEVHEHA